MWIGGCSRPSRLLPQALAVGVGPQAGGWEAAAAALKAAKTDVSKPVREAAAGALPILAELLGFLGSGAPAQQWPAACGALLAAEPGGKRLALGGGPPAKAAACKAGAGPEDEAPAGYIRAVHPAGAGCSAPLPPPPPPAGVLPPGAGFAPPPPLLPTGPLAASGGDASPQLLAAQLSAVLERQSRLEAAFAGFAASTQATLQCVQQCLAGLGADVAALAVGKPGTGASGWGAPAAAMQQRLAAGMACTAAGVQQAQQARAALGVGAGMPAQAPGSQGGGSPAACPKRLSSLHRCYDSLDRQLHQAPAAPSPCATANASTPRQPAAGAAAASRTAGAAPTVAPASGAAASAAAATAGPGVLPDWEAAYSFLEASPLAGDQQAQLRLLRALARSGPVWERLTPATGQRLMEAVTAMLQVGGGWEGVLAWGASSPHALNPPSLPILPNPSAGGRGPGAAAPRPVAAGRHRHARQSGSRGLSLCCA